MVVKQALVLSYLDNFRILAIAALICVRPHSFSNVSVTPNPSPARTEAISATNYTNDTNVKSFSAFSDL